jgi:hypothetical protein
VDGADLRGAGAQRRASSSTRPRSPTIRPT